MKNNKNVLKIKNSKGITLIALVITIIVLIILAGVSINLVLGENGIITRAKQAKTITEESQLNEQIKFNEIVEYMENNGVITSGVKKDINGVEEGKSGYLGSGYDDPYIPVGFTHIGTEDWNSGYQIQETSTGNVFVWVPCVLSKNQNQIKTGDNVQIFKKTLPSTTATTDPYYKYNKDNFTITGDISPASNIKTSVGKYGGFYIAAYEAGIKGTTDNSSTNTATNGSVKPLSKAGCGVWNYISRTNASIVAASMVNTIDGVKSGLISGECWDTTLQWMVNSSTNAATNVGYDTNSSGKGWYNDVSSSKRHTTGYYAVNNIYDMGGNVGEWTTEYCTNNGTSYFFIRGGLCGTSGSDKPAAVRIDNTDYAYYDIAFRVVLYK